MKRIVCCVLAVAVLFTAAVSWADSGMPFVQHIWEDEILADWAGILGLDRAPESEPMNDRNEVLASLRSDNPPDFFAVDGYAFAEYRDAGFCAPFTPSKKMLDEIAAMPPVIRQLLEETVFTADGRMYAYPEDVYMEPMMFWVPEAWKDSPFREMTPPSSYTELLDFLEVYLDTPHEGFCFFYDISGSTNPPRDWIYRLIESWLIQRLHHKQEVKYNDPEFISLLERTVELSRRLYKAEPNKKKQKGRQLFQNQCTGHTNNNLDTVTYASLIPWRITADQEPLVFTQLDLYCAREGSPFASRTTELFDCIVDNRLVTHAGEVKYLGDLFLDRTRIDVEDYNRQILREYGSKWKYMYLTREYLDSIWETEKYGVPAVVCKSEYLAGSSLQSDEKCFRLIRECADGKLAPAALAAEMDRQAGKGE